MKKLIFTLALAGLCAGEAWADVSASFMPGSTGNTTPHCYQISSADDLYEFAKVVNGGKTKICGQLAKDIDASASAWTPMMDYSGYFEGNGHTITGLYYPKTGTNGQVGLFGSVQSGAIIKNVLLAAVNIVAGGSTGGIVGSVSGTDVIIDGCGVSGTIDASGDSETDFGGLVGNVSTDAQVTIANSYNAASVGSNANNDQNGLIGFIYGGATVNLFNCYNSGTGATSYLFEYAYNSSQGFATVNVNSLGCIGSSSACKYYAITAAGYTQESSEVTVYSGDNAETNMQSAFDANASSSDYQSTYVTPVYTNSTSAVGKMLALGTSTVSVSGVTFSYTDGGATATIADGETTLSIPQDIKVDAVKFSRTFLSTKSATIALPFDVSDLSTLSGASFYEPTGVIKRATDADRDTITGQIATSIVAYKPYVITPAAEEGTLVFTDSVTLKQTPTDEASFINTFADGWNFVATVAQKRWDAVGSKNYPDGNNADEIGRVYGFAGTNPSGIEYGKFVRAVTNVAINPLRAYLKYTGELPTNCANALCKTAADADSIVAPSETIVFSIVEPVVTPSDSSVNDPSDSTVVIQKLSPVVGTVKADRWFDMSGRALQKKPSAKGTYIKNRSVVIIK